MSNKITIGLGQFAVKRGDYKSNIETIEALAKRSKEQNVDILFLPEMATTGFDWQKNRALLSETQNMSGALQQIARTFSIDLSGSFLTASKCNNPANTLIYIDSNGSVLGQYNKVHLFTLFNEQRHVDAGDQIINISTAFGTMGCSICYDLRFPELFRRNMLDGAVFQFLPAAFPHPRLMHWQTLVRARAIENQNFFIAVNQCGLEGHSDGVGQTQYFGHSMVVDPFGEILFEADETEQLGFVEIDLSQVEASRKKMPSFQDRRSALYGE